MMNRASAFFDAFTAEVLALRRRLSISKNLAIVVLTPLTVVLIFSLVPIGLVQLASEQSWELLNQEKVSDLFLLSTSFTRKCKQPDLSEQKIELKNQERSSHFCSSFFLHSRYY